MITFSDYIAARQSDPGIVGDAARLLADAGPLDTFEDALIFSARTLPLDPRTLTTLEAAARAYNRTR